ncbi:uncharacterized protein LOC132750837 [Ruditapes philippinarum]|uniref:uncharacterized protein LOC132750837 n=1 Tax=Ruditapes philippinarum TaxID=129788 RepID=UPI00295AA334|nr:uncharacterized protein LOC132750837 [Ruditapes philippinarum]
MYRKRRFDEEVPSQELHFGYIRHRIRRQTYPYGDFAGDELLPPPDSSGLNGVVEIPPFPGKHLSANDGSAPIMELQMLKPQDRIFGTTTEKFESDVLLPSK